MSRKVSPRTPATDAESDGGGMCVCPACGAAYMPFRKNCQHLVADWCFTAPYEAGNPKGTWPTAEGTALLVAFDTALWKINSVLQDLPGDPANLDDKILEAVPPHLRDLIEGDWSDLLDARIAEAPGFIGTNSVTTDHMVSDSWKVHWARNAERAAKHVEKAFQPDVARLQAVVAMAKGLVGENQ